MKTTSAIKEILEENYPNFPEIEFADFLDMFDRFQKKNVFTRLNVTCNPDTDTGFQTVQFVAFHSVNPQVALEELVQGKFNPLLKLPN